MSGTDQEIIALLELPADKLQLLEKKLTSLINQLINEDFERLVYILYRVDVDEQKLKQILQNSSGNDAPQTIASLIIERQIEKFHSRKAFPKGDKDTDNGW